MIRQGKGGAVLGVTMIYSFFAASVVIVVMVFCSPLLVEIVFKFCSTEIFSSMLLGLLAGAKLTLDPARTTVVLPDRIALDAFVDTFKGKWHYLVLSDLGVRIEALLD